MLSNGGKVVAGWLARDRAEFLRRPFSEESAAESANIIARTREGGDAGITETNVASSGGKARRDWKGRRRKGVDADRREGSVTV